MNNQMKFIIWNSHHWVQLELVIVKENLQLIINTCKLIYLYSSTTTKNPSSGLNSLIYCTDGYTELSLLVFCYLMYSLNISLDEAILELHLTYGRPFYIFS